MRLLVTRPEPDATRTADALRIRGHEVLAAPLLAMQTIAVDFAGPYDAVLMTSANAARAIAAHPRAGELTGLSCFTVGARTAEAARAAGFARVQSADGALGDLVDLVAANVSGSARLVYVAGEDRAGDPAAELATRGIRVDTAVFYRAVASERLPSELALAFAETRLQGALHYSRRSAATLVTLAGNADLLEELVGLSHYCLSDEVAAPLRAAGAGRVQVAGRPDEASLLALIQE